MKAAKRVRRKSRREWMAIIEAQVASGKTAGIYCREQGIPYESFLYNRRKAKQRKAVLPSESAFVPVHVSSTFRVILRLPSGVVLECDRLPEASWLVELSSGGKITC